MAAMLRQASSETTGLSLFRESEHYLTISVWCDSCRTLWLSDGELPESHKTLRTHDVIFKEEPDYVDKIIYLECKSLKKL